MLGSLLLPYFHVFWKEKSLSNSLATCPPRTLPLFRTESPSSTVRPSTRKTQLHYSFGSFQCWTCWETWPAAFWRARADLLLPFLDGDFFLRGSVEGSSCPPSSSSSSSSPFFLFLLITSSLWKNLRGGGNEEDPEGCGTDVSRTAPILIERLWIGMSSSGWWVGLRRDGNRITG